MTNQSVVLAAPNQMIAVRIHQSLYEGLTKAAAVVRGEFLYPEDGERLRSWAEKMPADSQRAALARAIADLIYVCDYVRVTHSPTEHRYAAGGFWEAVA